MDQLLALLGTVAAPGVVPAASEAEDISQLLWLLGPIGGVGFFMMVYLRYRNTNKRHAYERETKSDVLDMRTYDQRVSSVKGVRNSSIAGANHGSPRSRLGNGTTVTIERPPPANPVEQMVDQAGRPAPPAQQTPPVPPVPEQSAPPEQPGPPAPPIRHPPIS